MRPFFGTLVLIAFLLFKEIESSEDPRKRKGKKKIVEYPITEDSYEELSQYSRSLSIKIHDVGTPIHPPETQQAVDDLAISTTEVAKRRVKTRSLASQGNAIQSGLVTPNLRGISQQVRNRQSSRATSPIRTTQSVTSNNDGLQVFHSPGTLDYHQQQQLFQDSQYHAFLSPQQGYYHGQGVQSNQHFQNPPPFHLDDINLNQPWNPNYNPDPNHNWGHRRGHEG